MQFVQHIDGVEVPAGTVKPKPQTDLLRPNPMIPAATSFMGVDIWRDPRTCRMTSDVEDLFLTDAQLIAKYGRAGDDKALAAGIVELLEAAE
jgi:hypothetical protein